MNDMEGFMLSPMGDEMGYIDEVKLNGGIMTDNPSEVKIDETNPKDRLGILKPRLDLIPPASLIYQGLAMQFGAVEKPIKQPDGTFTYGYGGFNWRTKKVKFSVYLGAILRHYLRILDGCDFDDESKYPEIGHLIASAGILADAIETGNIIDDRPPKGAAPALLARYTKKTS